MNLKNAFYTALPAERTMVLEDMMNTIDITSHHLISTPFVEAIWEWALQPTLDRLKIARAVSDVLELRNTYHLLLGDIELAEARRDFNLTRELHDAIEDEVIVPLGDLLDNTPGCDYDSSYLRGEGGRYRGETTLKAHSRLSKGCLMKRRKRKRQQRNSEVARGFRALALRENKRDANEPEIVEALTRYGCQVIPAPAVVEGFPDLIVCKFGVTMFLEIKNPKTGWGRNGLSPKQRQFADWWGGPVGVARNAKEAVDFVFATLQAAGVA